jgi:hypothetical protein
MGDGAKRWPRLIIPQYTGLERNRAEIRGKEYESLRNKLKDVQTQSNDSRIISLHATAPKGK